MFAKYKQKEKSLNPIKLLDVQDRTHTGCLRSLRRYVPDPPQALSVLFLLWVIIPEDSGKANYKPGIKPGVNVLWI